MKPRAIWGTVFTFVALLAPSALRAQQVDAGEDARGEDGRDEGRDETVVAEPAGEDVLPPPVLDEVTLQVGARSIDLGCAPEAWTVWAGRFFGACGAAVRVVELRSGAMQRLRLRAPVRDFFVRRGQLWVELEDELAAPLERARGPLAPGGAQPAPAPEPEEPLDAPVPPPPASPRAEVPLEVAIVSVDDLNVILDAGEESGLRVGDRVELLAPGASEEEVVRGERERVVGEVLAVGGTQARVQVGVGEEVDPAGRARTTDLDPTASRVAPPRVAGLSLTFGARGLLGVGDSTGVGIVADAELTYRFRGPWFLRALVDPLGFGAGQGPEFGLFGGSLFAGYDHPLFEVGVGLGLLRVDYENFDGGDELRRGIATTFTQSVRFGAVDGLHLQVFNSFAFVEGDTEYGATRVQLQIPMGPTSWLLFRGAGGRYGAGWGELGLRLLAHGNGGSGSLFVTPAIGGGVVWTHAERCTDFGCFGSRQSYAGPTLGVSVEYRP